MTYATKSARQHDIPESNLIDLHHCTSRADRIEELQLPRSHLHLVPEAHWWEEKNRTSVNTGPEGHGSDRDKNVLGKQTKIFGRNNAEYARASNRRFSRQVLRQLVSWSQPLRQGSCWAKSPWRKRKSRGDLPQNSDRRLWSTTQLSCQNFVANLCGFSEELKRVVESASGSVTGETKNCITLTIARDGKRGGRRGGRCGATAMPASVAVAAIALPFSQGTMFIFGSRDDLLRRVLCAAAAIGDRVFAPRAVESSRTSKRCEQHRDGRHDFFPHGQSSGLALRSPLQFLGTLTIWGIAVPNNICRYIIFMFFIFTSYIYTDTLYSIIFSLPQILDHHDLPEAEHLAFLLRNSILCKIFPGHWQPKTSIITVQCQNGYIGKVATIGDTPIFHFQDYGRKYVHMPLQEFPQSSFSICRRPGTWCLKYHCVIRETSSFTKQRHFGGSCGIGLHQPPCLWWRACHPQRPRKNPHGDLHLVADGPMTSDFVSTQKRVNSIVVLEKCSFLLLLFIIFSFNIFKGLVNIW